MAYSVPLTRDSQRNFSTLTLFAICLTVTCAMYSSHPPKSLFVLIVFMRTRCSWVSLDLSHTDTAGSNLIRHKQVSSPLKQPFILWPTGMFRHLKIFNWLVNLLECQEEGGVYVYVYIQSLPSVDVWPVEYMPRPKTYTIDSEAYAFLCQSSTQVHQFPQIQLSDLGTGLPCYSFLSELSYYECYKHTDLQKIYLLIQFGWESSFFPITLCLFPFLWVLLSFCRHWHHFTNTILSSPRDALSDCHVSEHGADTTWTEGCRSAPLVRTGTRCTSSSEHADGDGALLCILVGLDRHRHKLYEPELRKRTSCSFGAPCFIQISTRGTPSSLLDQRFDVSYHCCCISGCQLWHWIISATLGWPG